MKSSDLWLVSFGLRCSALLVAELGCFLFVVPTLFNLHSDIATATAAFIVVLALVGGFLGGAALTREFNLIKGEDHE